MDNFMEQVMRVMQDAKPGTIRVVEYIDLPFDNAYTIPSTRIPGLNGTYIPCGNNMGNERSFGFKVKRGGKGSNNDRTAKWRKRRGGAFCNPLNKKFKIKT